MGMPELRFVIGYLYETKKNVFIDLPNYNCVTEL